MNLITGVTGLVGSHIARKLLQNGEKVIALKRSSSSMQLVADIQQQIIWIEGDVTDILSLNIAMQGVKKVYHCAAMISFLPEDKEKMFLTNINGTANVVNACLKAGVEKLLYISSVAAFGRTYTDKIVDETFELKDSKNNFNYYKSKLYAEREVWRGEAEGLCVNIIAPSTILGNGNFAVAPLSVFNEVQNGLPFYPKGANGFVYVNDVVNMAIMLMESDIAGEKIICSAENLTMREFIQLVATALHKKAATFALPGWLGTIAYTAANIKAKITGTQPLITKETITIAQLNFYYNNQKAKEIFNYSFMPIGEAVAKVATHYRNTMQKTKQ